MAKRYSAKFKFQVVLELLSGEKTTAQVAKAYGIHPNTANAWKNAFLEKGAEVFSQDSMIAEYERRIAEMEQLLGKKEVEIALLKNFLGQPR
jgi:transposase-like protein